MVELTLDRQLRDLVFEKDEYEEAPDSWGYQSVLCWCKHQWHVGPCMGRVYMSQTAVGYVRSRPCDCSSPRVG